MAYWLLAIIILAQPASCPAQLTNTKHHLALSSSMRICIYGQIKKDMFILPMFDVHIEYWSKNLCVKSKGRLFMILI
jgi:hypothetical protein